MRPLQSIAMGFVVIALTAPFAGYDALPDPLGWVLVLLGVRQLPADLERRRLLLALAGLAGLVAVPLWLPSVAEAVADTDPSLAWALTLPQLGFLGVLCHALAARATAAAHMPAARRFHLGTTLVVVVALLPVLVLGAGVDALATPAAVLAVGTVLFVVWQLFAWSGRTWAGAPEPPEQADGSGRAPAR